MNPLGVDEGFLRRLREAGAALAWRPAEGTSSGGTARPLRVARLHEEDATVGVAERDGRTTVEASAGPTGAVVLLLEADRRGPPTSLGSRNGRRGSAFPQGSIVAGWGGPPVEADARPTLRDLVELARYALP